MTDLKDIQSTLPFMTKTTRQNQCQIAVLISSPIRAPVSVKCEVFYSNLNLIYSPWCSAFAWLPKLLATDTRYTKPKDISFFSAMKIAGKKICFSRHANSA